MEQPKRTRRGRAGHASEPLPKAVQPLMQIPAYDLGTEDQLDLVHHYSMRILEEAGIAFYDEESRAILRQHGVVVDNDHIARFDRELIGEYLKKAPSQWVHVARNRANDVIMGGNHIVFAPVAGPPYVEDITGGGRREGTLADLINFIKMAQTSPYIHNQGTEIVTPNDVPYQERHLDIVYNHFKYGDKPTMGQYPIGMCARDSVDMARIVFGSDFVESNTVLLGVVNVSSPRRLDDRMLGLMKAYSRTGQSLVMTPFILAGAMGPATVLGTVAQANAEAIAAIAFAQMLNPGTPCVYGPFLAAVDLQSGSPVFGSAESVLAQMLVAQMARRYNLPFRGAGTYVSTKTVDAQAGYESVMSMFSSLLVRSNFVLHGAGWLENGLASGYEKFAWDNEVLGVFQRLLGGVSWDEEEWAMESILNEVPPGGHHLGTAHTLKRFRTAFHRADVFDYNSYEQWKTNGFPTAVERASSKAQQLLDSYEQPPLDPSIDEELLAFVARRRSEVLPSDFE